MDTAADHAAKLLNKKPKLTVFNYSRTLRYKNRKGSDHLLEGLRNAGVPE